MLNLGIWIGTPGTELVTLFTCPIDSWLGVNLIIQGLAGQIMVVTDYAYNEHTTCFWNEFTIRVNLFTSMSKIATFFPFINPINT